VRIGLLRHFPVQQPFPTGWPTAGELETWLDQYDVAAVTIGAADLAGVSWQVCLASDLPRARTTAQTLFPGEREHTPLLREIRFTPFRTGNLRLPMWAWWWLLRFAWMSRHPSQRACRQDIAQRVQNMADRLCAAEQDTLVVSHAGLMAFLSAELRRRGFTGPKLRLADHARCYVYEKTI